MINGLVYGKMAKITICFYKKAYVLKWQQKRGFQVFNKSVCEINSIPVKQIKKNSLSFFVTNLCCILIISDRYEIQ